MDKISENNLTHTDQRALKVHRHTLVEMNRSVYTARRNAGYKYLLKLMTTENLKMSKLERLLVYKKADSILRRVLSDTVRSQVILESPLVKFLNILNSTITAIISLMEYEVSLSADVLSLNDDMNDDLVNIPSIDSKSSNLSEGVVLETCRKLLFFGESMIEKDYHSRRENFSQEEIKRYEKARQEYEIYFAREAAIVIEESK